MERDQYRQSAQEFEDGSVGGSQMKNANLPSSRMLDKDISIRVSKMNDNMDMSDSEDDRDNPVVEENKQRMSIFSQSYQSSVKSSNFPNISDMYKQQAPSKFQDQVRKRKESESLLPSSIEIKFGPQDYQPSKFHASQKKDPITEWKKQEADNESVASSRKQRLDYRELQQFTKNVVIEDDPGVKRNSIQIPYPNLNNSQQDRSKTSFQAEASKTAKNIDVAKVIEKVRKAIKEKLLNNIKFFNILSKTYQIDERSMKERYFYLYNDPAVDLEHLKLKIREAIEKKEHDVKEIHRILNKNKVQSKESLLFWLCCKRTKNTNEPDYSFKDKLDIPMKFEPIDNFVFDLYSPYLILWNTALFFHLLAQVFLKVVYSH